MPIYMKYGDVIGNVKNKSHCGWIEVDSFQWGVGRGISSPTGGSADRESSAPSVSEIVVTKQTDSSSPSLFHACLGAGKVDIPVIFSNAGSGRGNDTLELTNAVIIDIKPDLPPRSGGRKGKKYEKLTINFEEYHFNGAKNVPIPHTLVHFPGS
jgi:type VI secretion system Hcp family effector